MSKCVKCNKRKAKRPCPALGSSICSLCCGLLREKDISCPSNCSYLTKHKPYQDKRFIEKQNISSTRRNQYQDDILKNERTAWMVFNIELSIIEFGKENTISDKDVLLALHYVKDKVNKDKSIFIMPDNQQKSLNPLGEYFFQNIETCRFEKKILIPGEYQQYSQEEKLKCLDRVILEVNYFAKDNLDGRAYLEQLLHRFTKMKNSSSDDGLITSS